MIIVLPLWFNCICFFIKTDFCRNLLNKGLMNIISIICFFIIRTSRSFGVVKLRNCIFTIGFLFILILWFFRNFMFLFVILMIKAMLRILRGLILRLEFLLLRYFFILLNSLIFIYIRTKSQFHWIRHWRLWIKILKSRF